MGLNVPTEISLFPLLCAGFNAVEKMTRNSNALKRDGSVMPDSDVVDFLSGSTNSAINFSRSAYLHTHIHPLLLIFIEGTERRGKTAGSTKEKVDKQRR